MSEIVLVVATANPGKAVEIRALLPGLTVKTLDAFPEIEMPPETGDTFEANAVLKAEYVAKVLNCPALADDSGLSVDALDGAPGVYSARYGEGTDEDRYKKLLGALESVPKERRTARFECCMAFARPDVSTLTEEATCEGEIVLSPRGEGGFGYDPVFQLEGRSETMAELPGEEKNRISHRGKAIRAILPHIKAHFSLE